MKATIPQPTSQLWLQEMAGKYPNAVKSFEKLFIINGFNSIGHVFAQINKSFPVIDNFYSLTDVHLPAHHTKDMETLQNYLELAFEKFEDTFQEDAAIASNPIFENRIGVEPKVVIGTIEAPEKISIEAPENAWMNDMEKKFPMSVQNFLGMLNKNGYSSLDSACADIEGSFPLIERYLSNNGVQAPLRFKEDTQALQNALAIAYKNSEAECLEMMY